MTQIDPRTPVIVGVAQNTVRKADLPGPEPLAAWEKVCRAAVADARLDADIAATVETIALTNCMSWAYDDPIGRLAERLGADPRTRHDGPPSGTAGQTLLDKVTDDIRAGRSDIALVCGGEALASVRWYRAAGSLPPWSHRHDNPFANLFDLDGHQHPGEVAVGLTEGVGAVYGIAMRDIARRAHLGIAPDAYRRQLGETMAGLTHIAATNPDAWFAEARNPDDLITPRADNRMVTYPYTKRMVSMIEVDITAAILILSEEKANALGVPQDRRVYPWASCKADDPTYVAVRDTLWKSEGMEQASKAVLDAAHVTMDEVAHVDLYSCFSAAVNFARDALGIADRGGDQVTVTGGLPYAGGPASSYIITSTVGMVRVLRDDPGSLGLVSGMGMLMSNHAFALYSTRPPENVDRVDRAAVQASLDAIPQRRVDDSYVGPATVVTYTVMHDRLGEISHGAAICDLPTGDRAYVRIRDKALLEEAEATELVGRRMLIVPGDVVGELVPIDAG